MKTNLQLKATTAAAVFSVGVFAITIWSACGAEASPQTEAKGPWETASFQAAVFSAIFTILAGIVAGVWAVITWQREAKWRREDHEADLQQRKEELRWKQAELARDLLDDIFDYSPSNDAWRMVDGEESYKDAEENKFQIDMVHVRRALPKPWNDERGGPDVYVRWCFDALFYYLERLESSLKLELVRMEDLTASASYYIALMATDKKLFEDYAKVIRFPGAIAFMERFPEWRNKQA
jgi:hypothetical protein